MTVTKKLEVYSIPPSSISEEMAPFLCQCLLGANAFTKKVSWIL